MKMADLVQKQADKGQEAQPIQKYPSAKSKGNKNQYSKVMGFAYYISNIATPQWLSAEAALSSKNNLYLSQNLSYKSRQT